MRWKFGFRYGVSKVKSICNLDVDTGNIDQSASMKPEPTNDSTLESPYRPLGPTQIRIVEILPGDFEQPIQIVLKTVDLEDKPTYDALSYVWNPTDGTVDVSKTLHPAIIKGAKDFPIKITANLDAAIRYLRQDKFNLSALWVDALCINQDQAQERNHQVSLMSRVYFSAKHVLIWLGPPCQDSEFAFEALTSGSLVERDIDRFLTAVELLIRRDWFGRLWVAQELTLSQQEPIVHHGSQIMDWGAFSLAIEVIKDRIENTERSIQSQYLRLLTAANIEEISGETNSQPPIELTIPTNPGKPQSSTYQPINVHTQSLSQKDFKFERDPTRSHPPAVVARAGTILQLREMRNAGFKASLADRILHTAFLQATDPRDRVYGLLGFSKFNVQSITPDYNKSIQEVYAEAAAVVMHESFSDYLYFLDQFEMISSFLGRSVSWFPYLNLLALSRRSGPTISPPPSVLGIALATTGISHPKIEFSDNYQRLHTRGRVLGIIKSSDHINLGNEPSHRTSFWNTVKTYDADFGHEKILSALRGYSNFAEFNQKEMACLDGLDKPKWMTEVRKLVASYSKGLTIFVTDTGFVGVSPHKWSVNTELYVVAGLFDINIPFVLEETSDGNYKMVRIVFLANHALGDINLNNEQSGQGEGGNGVIREFTII